MIARPCLGQLVRISSWHSAAPITLDEHPTISVVVSRPGALVWPLTVMVIVGIANDADTPGMVCVLAGAAIGWTSTSLLDEVN